MPSLWIRESICKELLNSGNDKRNYYHGCNLPFVKVHILFLRTKGSHKCKNSCYCFCSHFYAVPFLSLTNLELRMQVNTFFICLNKIYNPICFFTTATDCKRSSIKYNKNRQVNNKKTCNIITITPNRIIAHYKLLSIKRFEQIPHNSKTINSTKN